MIAISISISIKLIKWIKKKETEGFDIYMRLKCRQVINNVLITMDSKHIRLPGVRRKG